MKILVCGSAGQLGSELGAIAPALPYEFIFTDVATLDITDFDQVQHFVAEHNIDVVVNCAAYTAVDRAQSEWQLAQKINAQGPDVLARVAAQYDKVLVHISTDYVFDGTKRTPYIESDPVCALGVYGSTKRQGEMSVIESHCRGIIIRTSWLYSTYGNNFVKTMLRLGAERQDINVVDDQMGTPTYAADLARAIVDALPKIANYRGEIYHYSNAGQTSWAGFAKEIMSMASLPCRVVPVTSEQYPTPTERPKYSVLSKDKIISELGVVVPRWEDSLQKCLNEILK